MNTQPRDEMRSARAKALGALREYVTTAGKLNEAWSNLSASDETLDAGYPACLPSFDQHCNELLTWLEKSEEQQVTAASVALGS